ncbi:MAG: accessory factor UbiK family protein, partial [Pseudomonadota bacterium]
MQSRSRILDDLSQLMTNAAGVAQGVKTEAETVVRQRMERLIADMDLVTREDFEVVREMAQTAR